MSDTSNDEEWQNADFPITKPCLLLQCMITLKTIHSIYHCLRKFQKDKHFTLHDKEPFFFFFLREKKNISLASNKFIMSHAFPTQTGIEIFHTAHHSLYHHSKLLLFFHLSLRSAIISNSNISLLYCTNSYFSKRCKSQNYLAFFATAPKCSIANNIFIKFCKFLTSLKKPYLMRPFPCCFYTIGQLGMTSENTTVYHSTISLLF